MRTADHTDEQRLPVNNFNYQDAPQACVYIETKAFGLNHLPSAALKAAMGPGLSSSAPLHSSRSETQLKAAHHAPQPKITLHVSHPERNADSSVPLCGKWPLETFTECSYF